MIQHIVFMFIFILTLAYYCDEKASMLTKNFLYNPNNYQFENKFHEYSRLSKNFPDTFTLTRKSRLSEDFPNCPETLQTFQWNSSAQTFRMCKTFCFLVALPSRQPVFRASETWMPCILYNVIAEFWKRS